MLMEPLTDIEKDITLNSCWVHEQTFRFLGWEILCRIAEGEQGIPVNSRELCDMIGANDKYVWYILRVVKNKLNAK